jgi:transposase-like protein
VRTIAYRKVVYLDIHYAEYRARCDCCKTFRSTPEGVDLKCDYDNKVRQAVLDRLLGDGMSVQKIKSALKRDFLLDLSDGFLYDCLRREVARLDMQPYRQWVLENFSGTLCIDELHLGRYTLLLATDPLQDFPVAFALVGRNDGEHMRRFLQNLAEWGLSPEVVVTDGSALYPNLLADLWPEARHQLCLFHVLQDINQCVLDAVKRMRRHLSNRGKRGRRRRRGRPSKSQQKRRKRRQKTLKDKAKFVFRHRHLIVKRRENFSEQDRKHLRTMLEYLPGLKTLREFVDRLGGLFEKGQSRHQALCRRAALVRRADFAAVPELAKAIKMLEPEKFDKMIAFLESPACRQVRTNNHVERANRKLRHYEKVRYKWRRRRTIVRFLLLAIVRWWHERPHTKPASQQRRQRNSNPTIRNESPRRTAV